MTKSGETLLSPERINLEGLSAATLGLLDDLEALADAVAREDALRREEAMHEEAQAWWCGLGEDERAEYEAADQELFAALLDGLADPRDG